MASSTDPSPGAAKPPTNLLHALLTSTTNSRLARLNKILSTSSGLDTTLTLVGYSSYLVASQLPRLETPHLQSLLKRLSLLSNAVPVPKPSIASLTVSLKTLAGMCSDVRAFTRLWGLLGVWAAVRRLYMTPPKDAVLNSMAWAQTATLGGYLFYENGYYLAGKGVLQGWSPEKQKKWAKNSLKMFFAYVLVEWVKLLRQRQLREEAKAKVLEKEADETIKARLVEEENWWRAAMVDAAYTPLTMHWASEAGFLSEGWVGALMTVVGWVKFKAAWAAAA